MVIFALSFLRGECDKGEERDVRVSLASAIWGENGGTQEVGEDQDLAMSGFS